MKGLGRVRSSRVPLVKEILVWLRGSLMLVKIVHWAGFFGVIRFIAPSAGYVLRGFTRGV